MVVSHASLYPRRGDRVLNFGAFTFERIAFIVLVTYEAVNENTQAETKIKRRPVDRCRRENQDGD